MKLLYSLVSSNKHYSSITQIRDQIEPIVFDILHTLDTNIIKSKELSAVDIYDHVDNKDPEYLEETIEENIHNLQMRINSRSRGDYQEFFTRFTPIPILQSIIKNHHIYDKIDFRYESNTVLFETYTVVGCKYSDIVIKAVKILSFLKYLNIRNRTIRVHYANTSFKKKFPNYAILGPHSVNSGVTTHFLDEAVIIIYREEESDKVLLHELVHYLRLDFAMSGSITYTMDQTILNETNVTSDERYINLFEAYTDSIAIIFNSIFNSILTATNVSDYFYTEVLYMERTAVQILDHFNINSIRELYDGSSHNIIEQSSSVLSYYILKLGLLYDTDRLLTQFFPLFQYDWTRKKVKNLYDFIKSNIFKIDCTRKSNQESLRMTFNELIYEY
jgi:hypothetical protein